MRYSFVLNLWVRFTMFELLHNARLFLGNRRGATLALFALSLPVVFGAAALAIDLSYVRVLQVMLQNTADAAIANAYEVVRRIFILSLPIDKPSRVIVRCQVAHYPDGS